MSDNLYGSFRDIQISNFEKILQNDFKSIFFLPDFGVSSVSYANTICKKFLILSNNEKLDILIDLIKSSSTDPLFFILNKFPELLYEEIMLNDQTTLIAFHCLKNNDLVNLVIHHLDILKTDSQGANILYYIGSSLYHQEIFKSLFDKISLLKYNHIQFLFNQPSRSYYSPIIKAIEDNNSYLLLLSFLFISPIEKTIGLPIYVSSPYLFLEQSKMTLDEHMLDLLEFSQQVYIKYKNFEKILNKVKK
jgi:hypothetical protein